MGSTLINRGHHVCDIIYTRSSSDTVTWNEEWHVQWCVSRVVLTMDRYMYEKEI